MNKGIRLLILVASVSCLLGTLAASQDHASNATDRPRKFLYIDAHAAENRAYIVESKNGHLAPSLNPVLDKREAPELHVVNRRFLTDYNIEITGTTTPEPAVIRGLEEAANLTLGTAGLIAPPAKGGIIALSPTSGAAVLAQLLDEAQANKPLAALESDYQELLREKAQIDINLQGLEKQYHLLMDSRGGGFTCEAVGGDPNLPDVLSCFNGEITQDTTGHWLGPVFTDENDFRVINVRAKYLLDIVNTVQTVITQANLPAGTVSLDSDLTQFEKNVDIFQAKVQDTSVAVRLYEHLARDEARVELRRDQLRVYFRNQLKASGDANAVVDDAELNRLVEDYVNVLSRSGGGFAVADAQVNALVRELPRKQAAIDRSQSHPFRERLNLLENGIQTSLPTKSSL